MSSIIELNAAPQRPVTDWVALVHAELGPRFAERGLTAIPEYGPLSWSVPGCVDGWAELHERFPADHEAAVFYARAGTLSSGNITVD